MRPVSVYSKYAYYLKEFATASKLANMALNRYETGKRKPILRSRPYKVTIDPGNFCNLRCPGCHTGIRHPEMITPSFMKLEDYIRIFDQLKSYTMSVALYNWGEPFLNKQIFDMIDYSRRNKVGTNVHSNFNHFSESMAVEAVKSGLTHIYLSIDGDTQESYSKYRVKGNIERVKENLRIMIETKKRLKSKFPILTWKYLVFEHNKHEIQAASIKAQTMGVDSFETFKAYEKLSDIYELAEDYKNQGDKIDLKKELCKSLWSSIYVNSDGSVLPCSLSYRESEVFGNLLQSDLKDIWNNASYSESRKMFTGDFNPDAVPMPCKGCKYFIAGLCAGTPQN